MNCSAREGVAEGKPLDDGDSDMVVCSLSEGVSCLLLTKGGDDSSPFAVFI